MVKTDGTPTIAWADPPTASQRIRAAREKADREGGFDLEVESHGSIVLIRPRTSQGVSWLDENVDPDAMKLGPAVACEPRYVFDIVTGAEADGLNVAAG